MIIAPAAPPLSDELACRVFSLGSGQLDSPPFADGLDEDGLDGIDNEHLAYLGHKVLALIVAEHVLQKNPRSRIRVLRVSSLGFIKHAFLS